jgi:hypothetical protein
MKVGKLLDIYTQELEKLGYRPEQNEMGTGLNHAYWMIRSLQFDEPIPTTKEQRWIGYIQCLLNCGGVYTLEELKQQSREYLS